MTITYTTWLWFTLTSYNNYLLIKVDPSWNGAYYPCITDRETTSGTHLIFINT